MKRTLWSVVTPLLLATFAGLAAISAENRTEDPAGLDWTRHGVVLDLGEKGDFDERGLESPIVLREAPDRLVMWYRGRTFADKKGRIMRAVSEDGIDWKRTGVVMVPGGLLEKRKIDPMTVRREEDGYRMWYGGAGKGGVALLATSPDGIEWTRHPDNPVLTKTKKSWDSSGAGGHHAVVHDGERYHMFYKGYGSHKKGWTFYGRAESEDGVSWKKRGRIISPDPDLGEGPLFRNLAAFIHGGHFYIVHAMSGTEPRLNLRLLRSENAEDWVRAGVVFSKGLTPGDHDKKWATSPSFLFEDGKVRMWYEGGDAKGKVRILYAETSEEAFFERAQVARGSWRPL